MFLWNMNQSDFAIFLEKEIDRRLRILTLRNGEIPIRIGPGGGRKYRNKQKGDGNENLY